MENALTKYIGREDLTTKAIKSFKVIQGIAKQTGNPYYALELVFINGYSKRLFLQDAELFAVCNAFDQVQSTQQVDAAF